MSTNAIGAQTGELRVRRLNQMRLEKWRGLWFDGSAYIFPIHIGSGRGDEVFDEGFLIALTRAAQANGRLVALRIS